MEIIEAGEVTKQWPREFRTPCCGSLLKLDPGDIIENTDYTGSNSNWFINCPVCGGQPDVPNEFKYDGDRWLEQQKRLRRVSGGAVPMPEPDVPS